MLAQYSLPSNHTRCPTVFHSPKLALIFGYMAFIKTATCCLATIQYDHSVSCMCKWYLDTNFCPFVVYSYALWSLMSKPWTASVIGSQPTLQILYTCTIKYTPKQTPLPPCILCIVWEQNQPCVLLLRMMIACLPRVLISGSHKDQLMQVEVRSNCNGSIQWKISYLQWKSTMENRVLMKWKWLTLMGFHTYS